MLRLGFDDKDGPKHGASSLVKNESRLQRALLLSNSELIIVDKDLIMEPKQFEMVDVVLKNLRCTSGRHSRARSGGLCMDFAGGGLHLLPVVHSFR